MFAVVRTGGKQYRVAAGDKIAVEKLAGEAGETITLGDVLLAGDGGEVKDVKGVVVSAEIIAQAKSEKVVVFKKRRRHNYPNLLYLLRLLYLVMLLVLKHFLNNLILLLFFLILPLCNRILHS